MKISDAKRMVHLTKWRNSFRNEQTVVKAYVSDAKRMVLQSSSIITGSLYS